MWTQCKDALRTVLSWRMKDMSVMQCWENILMQVFPCVSRLWSHTHKGMKFIWKTLPIYIWWKKNRCFSSGFFLFFFCFQWPRWLLWSAAAWTMQPVLLIVLCTPGPTQCFWSFEGFPFHWVIMYNLYFFWIFFKSLAKISFLYIVYIVSQCVMSRDHIQIWSLSCRTRLSWLVFPVIQYIYIYFF